MGLFDAIFRPKQAKESQKALKDATGYFKTITGYEPVFHKITLRPMAADLIVSIYGCSPFL